MRRLVRIKQRSTAALLQSFYVTVDTRDGEEEAAYVTKELASSPTRPTAAPPTAVILQPSRSVKMLTMGEQKKIIPIDREPTKAAKVKHKEQRGYTADSNLTTLHTIYNTRYVTQ